ncbi:MAG: hypothetical protein IT161_05080 [Bryobacterales bacterium]|nr:hypothetical protein [Bryobacterales bacterium]
MRLLALGFLAALCAAQPLQLHPENPRYFLFHGKPAALISSGEHYGAVLNAAFDYRRYLDTLAADGLNYTRIFTGSYVEVPGSFGIERNTLAPAGGSFVAPWPRSGGKFNLDAWNPAYFERLKDFIGEAGKRGIAVEVTLFCSTYGEPQWKASPFNPANNVNHINLADYKRLNTVENGGALRFQEKLTRKLVAELNAFDNITFELQNEPWADRPVFSGVINPYLRMPVRDAWPNAVELADAASVAWQTLVAGWIQSAESDLPKRHLIAQNICNFKHAVQSVIPGVSIVNFHYAFPEAAVWNLGLNKAIGYDETGFIGQAESAYRKQAWNFVLSGGGLFNHLDYSFSPGREDGTDVQATSPGGGSVALRKQFAVLSRTLRSLPFLSMRPDAGTAQCDGCVARCLSASGESYVFFVEGPSPARLRLDLPRGEYTAVWIDTQSGSQSPPARLSSQGKRVIVTSPAFDQDTALVVERRPKSPSRSPRP